MASMASIASIESITPAASILLCVPRARIIYINVCEIFTNPDISLQRQTVETPLNPDEMAFL